jgi:hypothetical protein
MSSPSILHVTSIHGQRIHLRRHSFAFLTSFDDDPRNFEATLVQNEPTTKSQLKVQVMSESFSWEFESRRNETQAAATDLLLMGRRGSLEVFSGGAGLRGSARWEDWRGCDQIDLVPVDAEGCVCGDSQSISHPSPVIAHASFRHLASRGEVTIRVDGLPTDSVQLRLWRRVQNGLWTRGLQEHGIPTEGIRVAIPEHVGAFVVTSHSGELVSVQFFAFGNLHGGDEADYAELQRQHSQITETVLLSWPLWFQTEFIKRLELTPDAAFSDQWLVDALRSKGRRALFAQVLQLQPVEWRSTQSIEEFAKERWPRFAPMLHSNIPDHVRAAAWPLRESELLAETMEWALPTFQHLELCVGWTARRQTALRIKEFVPQQSRSAGAIERLIDALARLKAEGKSVEIQTEEAWNDLMGTVETEFHCTVDELDAEKIHEALLLHVFHRAAVLWGGLPCDQYDLHACMDVMIGALTEARNSSLPQLVDECVTAGVIDPQIISGYPPDCAVIVTELQERLSTTQREEFSAKCKSLSALLANPIVIRLIACHLQSKSIELQIIANNDREDSALLAMQQQDAALDVWMRYALEQAQERLEQRRRMILLGEQDERLRSVLPSNFQEIDSQESLQWISERLTYLQRTTPIFKRVFLAHFHWGSEEARRMEQEIGALTELENFDNDRLARMDAAAKLITRWTNYQEEIRNMLADQIQPAKEEDRRTVLQLLDNGEYEAAEQLPRLLQKFASLNKVSELADFDMDPAFGEKIRALDRAVTELHEFPSCKSIERAQRAYDETMLAVSARGGVADAYTILKEELNRRLYAVEDELHAQGIQGVPHDVLARVCTAMRRVPAAGPHEIAAMLPSGVPRELLQEKFSVHRLMHTPWRSEA